MLPSYDAADLYYDNAKQKRRRAETPWGLLLVVLVLGTFIVMTRQRSLSSVKTEDAGLHTSPIVDGDTIKDSNQPSESSIKEDPESFELASAVFNPTIHSMYLQLPQLKKVADSIALGGWPFTPAVYDYAANHEAAKVLSWDKPRVVLFPSFLSPVEVGHLVAVAKERLVRSEVLSENASDVIDDVRTSFGAWPPWDNIIGRINSRIHRLMGIPLTFGEDIYILNYKLGQRYASHCDNVIDTVESGRSAISDTNRGFLERAGGPTCGPGAGGAACGDRIATFILYLKAPNRGGRTVFPRAVLTHERWRAAGNDVPEDPTDDSFCEVEQSLGVAPQPGDAVAFWDYEPRGGAGVGTYGNSSANPAATPVPEAMHSGCPVHEGEKWIATRWIRSARFS